MPKFDVNSTKILHTVINNIYTNKDIFIRELISNASDACEKLRYYNVSDEKYSKLENLDLKIETKQTLMGFYNYYKISIYKKETKKR